MSTKSDLDWKSIKDKFFKNIEVIHLGEKKEDEENQSNVL